MNATEWISRGVARLTASEKATADAVSKVPARSTHERLDATLAQPGEALSPRVLRRMLAQLQALIDERVSEVEGGRRAGDVAGWYASASGAERYDLWLLMSEQFTVDPIKVRAAQEKFTAAVGTPGEAAAEVTYRRTTVSPRRRILQRFSAWPGGVAFLVALRAEFQLALKGDKRLLALDVEMEYMFSTWFDVGFLDLRRISWDSPASLIEKLIQYEAVHDVRGWADMKNRLDSDRRCYGFFHPRLPEVPLIFVEVALMDDVAASITPLLDEGADAADLTKATTAIFYSISNTQTGLRGVGFGDSLIKRVVEALKQEFPRLKAFATLSPIPGFRAWLGKNAADLLERMSARDRAAVGRAIGFEPPTASHLMSALDGTPALNARSPLRAALVRWCAHYLTQLAPDGKPLDPVARFHLGNGARIERVNWAGDPSAKGLKQSCGLMVNYLYDLKRLDRHRAMLADGQVPLSADVDALRP